MSRGARPEGHAEVTLLNELQTAAACCKVVEATHWSETPGVVMARARKEGAASVTAVSGLSGASCRQQIMVFEANGLGSGTTYIVAFRAGEASIEGSVGGGRTSSLQDVGSQVVEGVDQALWRLAASVPLHSLPPLWLPGLQEGRERVILTGYSVGGAVAAVTTLQLLENAENDVMRNQIRCFTFGTPLQGGKSYADRINSSFVEHFYHAVYDGDPIPGMLTLVKKAAKDNRVSRDLYINVLAGICTLTGIAAGIAAAVVAPAAGVPLILPISAAALSTPAALDKLAADFQKLKAAPKLALGPELEFGGKLVRLIKHPDKNIIFGYNHGNSEFLEKVFGVERHHFSDRSLRHSEHTLGSYLQIIKDVHYERLRNAAGPSRVPAAPNEDVAQSSGCFPSRGKILELDGRKNNSWLLEPRFRRDNPVSVFLDQNGRNITVKVYGENIVLGIHVLYLDKDGVKKLRMPCTGSAFWWDFEDASTKQYNPMANVSSSAGLQFSAHLGGTNLSFKDGFWKVELAFGSKDIPASSRIIRKLDPMEDIHVAPRFAYMPPQELVEVLITSAKAHVLAMCQNAFIAIQNNRSEAGAIVKALDREFRESPSHECELLDRFLYSMSADQLEWSDREALPQEMQKVLGNRKRTKDKLTPLFPKNKAAEDQWTFSNCLKWAVQPILSEEMLSRVETAQELRLKLDENLEPPHVVLNAWLKSELEVKNFAKVFRFQNLRKWKEEKELLATAGKVTAIVSGSFPLAPIPFLISAQYATNSVVRNIGKCVGGLIGAPTGLLGVGIFYSAWFLVHVAAKPKRMMCNEPGLLDDWNRRHCASSKARLDDWNSKLQAACLLFEVPFKECADLSCDLEFHLYEKLKETGCDGCFHIKDNDLPFEITRHTLLDTLQVANYGYAARRMYEVRRYLTELQTTVALIGSVQAGKSTFAQLAFEVGSLFGTGMADRTRVMRRFSGIKYAEPGSSVNRQFAVIDYPGSTDVVDPDLYIRGLSLARVLVVFMNIMTDFTSTNGHNLILEVCKARRKDETISALFCYTHADHAYEKYEDELSMRNPAKTAMTARQLFEVNWTKYKNELRSSLERLGCIGEEWNYVCKNMHACIFRPTLQEAHSSSHTDTTKAQKLEEMGVKNVAWVKKEVLERLASIS